MFPYGQHDMAGSMMINVILSAAKDLAEASMGSTWDGGEMLPGACPEVAKGSA